MSMWSVLHVTLLSHNGSDKTLAGIFSHKSKMSVYLCLVHSENELYMLVWIVTMHLLVLNQFFPSLCSSPTNIYFIIYPNIRKSIVLYEYTHLHNIPYKLTHDTKPYHLSYMKLDT